MCTTQDRLSELRFKKHCLRVCKVYRHFKKTKWKWPSTTNARSKQYDKTGDCRPFIRLPGVPKLSVRGRLARLRKQQSRGAL